MRGIELYHVQGNGWNDIGYNFLVDKYGQVFEGRYGGIDRAVVGAHAQGFNTGSVGVAVLGAYGTAKISDAARRALVDLLAWRLDLAHVDPLSTLTWLSGGNPRFPAKVPVFLRAISGHRDTGFTECPGNAFYAQLPEIAREVSLTGAPKLYAPKVTGKLGRSIRFTATLSGEAQWTVTVADQTGAVVASQSGTGPALDWTWDSSAAPPGRYTWAISGPSLRGAAGSLGAKAATLAFQGAAAAPAVVSPGGDPGDDTLEVTYTLTGAATVTATLVGAAGSVATVFSGAQAAGAQTVTVVPPPGLAPGSYQVSLAAVAPDGTTASAAAPFLLDPTLASVAAPAAVSFARPGGATVTFALALGPVEAKLEILHGNEVVAAPAEGSYQAGTQKVAWDGTLAGGTRATDGSYSVRVTVTDPVDDARPKPAATRRLDAAAARRRLGAGHALPAVGAGDRHSRRGQPPLHPRAQGRAAPLLAEEAAVRVPGDRHGRGREPLRAPLPDAVKLAATRRSGVPARGGSRRGAARASSSRPSSSRSEVGGFGVSPAARCRLVHVDADAEHDPARARLRQDADELPPLDEHVVRVAQHRGQPRLRPQRGRDRVAGDERELGPQRHRRRRAAAAPSRGSPARAGACQPRPSRPRPSVCSSAAASAPSGASGPSSRCVEGQLATNAVRRPSRPRSSGSSLSRARSDTTP